MKKAWSNAELSELTIKSTNNLPTNKLVADDYQGDLPIPTDLIQGDGSGSGNGVVIPFFPQN